jgi:outer membrane lipoprotein carrier protein
MRALLISLLLNLSLLPAAGPNPPQSDAQQSRLNLLEVRYGQAHTLQVKFMERYTENDRFVRSEAGIAYFLRPGKMRWEYEVPEKNTFLVDGKYVWFYSPADRTATRMPAKQSEDWRTPLAFLTSHIKLSRLCAKIEPDTGATPAEPADSVFRCELRSAQDAGAASGNNRYDSDTTTYKGVLFEVSPDGELRRIVVRQQAGMELEFSFTAWEWNPPLDKSTFAFNPPRGVAIVDGLLPETPSLRQ